MLSHLSRTFRHNCRFRQQQCRRYKPPKSPPPPPPPPKLPKPPKKPQSFTFHDATWEDPYSWMSKLDDKVAMRHMDIYMEQEEKYTEAVLADTDRIQTKLQSEMASRLSFDLSTPPLRWGPWLYYRRVEEGKQYPVLCRRLASLHDEFISHKSPAAGFDFTSGKRIEQKLLDYNHEAQRFGGYAYEEMSEISPDHKFLAYTMYDKDNDYFKLCVRNLNSGALCSKPHADRVSNLAWAKNGQALLYVVTDQKKRPFRIYCSTIGSTDEDVLLHEETEGNVHVNIRHSKDFNFVTVNTFSPTFSKVFLINAADPLSGLALVWEHNAPAHCIIEHHQGFLYLFTDASKDGGTLDHHYLFRSPVHFSNTPRIWETVFIDDPEVIIEDVDFCKTHVSLIVKQMQSFKICVVDLPLKTERLPVRLRDTQPRYLPLPKHVSQISPGTNYDFDSPTMRFTISSLVMPDAVVDYDLLNGKWNIVQQQNMLHERTRVLYGTANSAESPNIPSGTRIVSFDTSEDTTAENDNLWNDLTEFYACDYHEVSSHDGAMVPLTVVYSRAQREENGKPGLLHVHGAYGEMLDKRWRSELKSLLDRGWVLAYADVRGGGGKGKKWHQDGRGAKKLNSIRDYIHCAKFLVENNIVQENKLAGWGYSAGGLVVASAINQCPDLFQAAVLKVPFLDPTHTLIHPILPLTAEDYEEFGYPGDIDDFHAIREYSPYDNIPKDVLYPAVLVTSSFNTRFGVWEAAKWVARVRGNTFNDPKRPVLLNLTTDIVEENRFLQTKESALEIAFLIKMMES
ncbi:hypothetical protein BRARA_I00871 [Brassica rapa]|uniref:Prolyl endopeptidase n=2 Tax=Brassica TaxID=3705 RepID=A0A078FW49_BRANA|nr:hypothetical protein BRARA_I00871 [Brassica rapa]CAF2037668.1 unnamed protein product [Brassica napus]CDY18630.1 BnaA09g07650D [Brassica napus]